MIRIDVIFQGKSLQKKEWQTHAHGFSAKQNRLLRIYGGSI